MKTRLPSLTLAAACLALLCAMSVSLRAATITVTNTADSGPGTLRAALASATNGVTINATNLVGTITLTSGQLNVSNSVTILGPGPGALTVSGNSASGVFNVTGSNVTISGLTVANGNCTSNGAGINAGGGPGSVLTVSDCVITNNSSSGTNGGGGIYSSPGVALTISNCAFNANQANSGGGGAILSSGNLTVQNCGFTNNVAQGGAGQTPGSGYNGGGGGGGAGMGGAIFSDGAVLILTNSVFSGNSAIGGKGGGGVNNGGNANPGGKGGGPNGGLGGAVGNPGGTGGYGGGGGGGAGSGSSGYAGGAGGYGGGGGGGGAQGYGGTGGPGGIGGTYGGNGGLAAYSWSGGGGGGAGLGGAVFAETGAVTVVNCTFTGNLATNGLQGANPYNGQPGQGVGGALFSAVTNVFVQNSTFSNNVASTFAPDMDWPCLVVTLADNGTGSLRQVLTNATNGNTITFGVSGTITLTNGQLNVSNSVTILGPGSGTLTVSGNNASGVFNVTGTNVTISGLTIANGYTSACGAGINAGGNAGSVINVSGCVIKNNSTTWNGGGIYNNAGVMLTVTNCTITGNSADDTDNGMGGGIYNLGTLMLISTTLSGDSAGWFGGGIYNFSGALTVSNCMLTDNSAGYYGGGIYNVGESGNVTATINASTLSGNSAGDLGGGILNGLALTVSNCTLTGNSAGFGGGIYNAATLMLISSTLSGNLAGAEGGGIYNEGTEAGASLAINTSTLSGNLGAQEGGGIYNEAEDEDNAMLTINASTLSGNSGGLGGGIYNAGLGGSADVEIGDTILNAGRGANIYNNAGTIISAGYNLSSDGGSGYLTNTADQVNINPVLGPLQNNGGPTWTCALLPGSPAIDQGKTNAVPGLAFATDQRGFSRPVDDPYIANAPSGDGSDIGAFEVQIVPVTTTADSGPGTLRAALASAGDGEFIDASGLSGTITLTSGELLVANSVTLLGPGPGVLTVSGKNASGVFNVTGTDVTISGLTIANGYSTTNGAGINAGGSPGSVLNVSGCVLTSNATALSGGGIYNSTGVTLTVSNSTISGNYANQGGGGIGNQSGALTVVASTLSGNAAGIGGGIMNNGASGGNATLTVNVSTISSNTAYLGGGGICNWGPSGNATLTINASTFSGNWAGGSGGGAIFNNNEAGTGTVQIGDTILNGGASGANIYNYSGPVTSDGYNLSSDNGGGYLTNIADQVNINPVLGPLQNNGGPTWTCALLPGSPAIDQGKTNAVPGLAFATDQRGFTRSVDDPYIANAPGGDGSDIGAFEVQIVPVTTTADSGPGTLRAALASAGGGGFIDASGLSGTITLTNGQLNVSNSVTLLGPGSGALTVSGNNACGVFNVTGTNVTISGLTIANGYSTANGAGINAGGGPGSFITVSDCVVTNNSTSQYGGGLFNSPGVTMTISNCTISGNSVSYDWGGGIFNNSGTLTINASTLSANSADWGGGIFNNSGTVTIDTSTLSANQANGAGGIYNLSGTLTINASTLSANSADGGEGGGICNDGSDSSAATVTINASILTANSADRGIGGGIYNLSGTVTINASTLSANSAADGGEGGGICNDGSDLSAATVTINASTLSGSSAYEGGGIYNNGSYSGAATLTINASTLSGNSANDEGGGIYNWGQSGSATLRINASTFNGNSASGSGGGIFNNNYAGTGTVQIGDTILNAGAAGGNIYNYSGTVKSDGYNLSSDGGSGYLTNTCDQINKNPLLGPLADNGGPTLTLLPLFGSPAIDAGNDSVTNTFATDQRGYPRLSGAHVDIGAVEAQWAPANHPPLLGNSTWTGTAGARCFQCAFSSVTNADFTVLASTNLALPLPEWTVLAPAIQCSPGQYQFTDPGATNYPQCFYRVVSP